MEKEEDKPLTDAQKKYVAEYLKDQNITLAAQRAGISRRTATAYAQNCAVLKAIKEELSKAVQKAGLTKEYVINGLMEVFERCMQHKPVMVFNKAEKCMEQATAIVEDPATGIVREEGIWEFDSSGANKAMELLGKNLKLFTDRIEVSKSGNIAERLARARKRTDD